jgi:hypothetical protein
VRFLDQSISSSQANCVDGSVLLCSILRKIGLNVGIMLVPGHAYVCVRDQENKQFIAGIETTMLGTSDLRSAVKMANSGGDYPLSKWNADYIYIDITESRKSRRNPIPFDEIAAIPSSRPYAGSHANSPAEIAREQRIILANKLSQRVTDLMSHRGSVPKKASASRPTRFSPRSASARAHSTDSVSRPASKGPASKRPTSNCISVTVPSSTCSRASISKSATT